jgi:hypothetical protein
MTNLLTKHYEAVKALNRFKKFALYFSADFKFGHMLYTQIFNADDMNEVKNILYRFFEHKPEIVEKPNMNFFI